MIHIALKFLQRHPQGQGHKLNLFSYEFQSFCLIIKTLIDFTGICYGDSYRSKVLFSIKAAPVSNLSGFIGYI